MNEDSQKAQLDAQVARVDQVRALYNLKKSQLDGMQVRAGADGVLQQIPVEVGQTCDGGFHACKGGAPGQIEGGIADR